MHGKNAKESALQVSWNVRITKYAGLISFGISVYKKPGGPPLCAAVGNPEAIEMNFSRWQRPGFASWPQRACPPDLWWAALWRVVPGMPIRSGTRPRRRASASNLRVHFKKGFDGLPQRLLDFFLAAFDQVH